MIWVIGGTSETELLLDKIDGKVNYVVSVATYSGREVLKKYNNIVVSRMNKDEMTGFIKENSIDMVVDLSHPYAVDVTQNAIDACERLNIKYLRYVRNNFVDDRAVYFNTLENCIDFLREIKGCVFFTTGMKNVRDFEEIKGSNRFVYRILPTIFSIEECVRCNVKMNDIVAVLGPVSKELNEVMFKEYGAKYVVMKDSGIEGGTPEKINACITLGITPIIIGRKEEDGIRDINKLIELVL